MHHFKLWWLVKCLTYHGKEWYENNLDFLGESPLVVQIGVQVLEPRNAPHELHELTPVDVRVFEVSLIILIHHCHFAQEESLNDHFVCYVQWKKDGFESLA